MLITTHQPIFLPWPAFFSKAVKADCMVLLDSVQFPRGRGWMSKNRLKSDRGQLWLTVPVRRKGKGLQAIKDVEIVDDNRWCGKHLRGIRQNYIHAPHFDQYYPPIDAIYQKHHKRLLELNLDLIHFFWEALSLKTELVLQSELGVSGRGTDLLIQVCRQVGKGSYLTFPAAKNHVDVERMVKSGVEVSFLHYIPPVYPQLWGSFIHNLSTLDMLFNCGLKCTRIITKNTGLLHN